MFLNPCDQQVFMIMKNTISLFLLALILLLMKVLYTYWSFMFLFENCQILLSQETKWLCYHSLPFQFDLKEIKAFKL